MMSAGKLNRCDLPEKSKAFRPILINRHQQYTQEQTWAKAMVYPPQLLLLFGRFARSMNPSVYPEHSIFQS